MASPFDLRELEYFVAAAEELNFTRAAERVFVTQPALSQTIAHLEGRLGVSLFTRTPKGVALTGAGEVLFAGARDLLDGAGALAERTRSVVREADARVRFGYIEYALQLIVSPMVAALLRRHPAARVERIEMPAYEVARALADRRIDVGFGVRPIAGRGISTRTIAEGQWLAVVPEGHAFARADEVPLDALDGERLLLFARALNHRVFDSVVDCCRRAGFEPAVVYETVQVHAGLRLVADGVGVLLIASYAVPELPAGLAARPVRGLDVDLVLAVAWRRDDDSPLVRTVVEAAP